MTELVQENYIVAMLRMKQLTQYTGLSKSHLHHLVREGQFPKPVKLSTRCSAWKREEVDKWLNSKEQEAA